MTPYAVQREYVASGLAMNGNEVPNGKPALGLIQKMRSHHQQIQVTKKQNQNRVVPVTLRQVVNPVASWPNYH